MSTIEPLPELFEDDLFTCERCGRRSDVENSVKCHECAGLFHEECFKGHSCIDEEDR